ncbi:glycosyltransferase family 2 protein, partial [Escherichia coli]|nr:glycosyltransferase family 2 protein [Escherichia coli]
MFSIVITTKDRACYLKRAVDSILKSTISPKDIVIINDGGKPIC